MEEAVLRPERGQIETGRVDERVWEALRKLLGVDARRLSSGADASSAMLAFYRADVAPAADAFAAGPSKLPRAHQTRSTVFSVPTDRGRPSWRPKSNPT